MRKVKGSYTVEAALVIPIWFMLCLFTMNICVQLYGDSQKLAAEIGDMEEMDIVHLFYISEGIGDILGDGDTVH